MSDNDLNLIRIDRELRHYKSQLAGKLGRFRTIQENAERLVRLGHRNPWWQDYELHKLAREMARIGLKYLALKERLEG